MYFYLFLFLLFNKFSVREKSGDSKKCRACERGSEEKRKGEEGWEESWIQLSSKFSKMSHWYLAATWWQMITFRVQIYDYKIDWKIGRNVESSRFKRVYYVPRSVPVRFVNPLGLPSQLLANRILKDPASRATRLWNTNYNCSAGLS